MSLIRCLIVDDEPYAQELLKAYIDKVPFLELVGCASNAFEALQIIQNTPIDLMFLDIQMPELSGMAFARTIINGPMIVFTTAYEQYALEGYKVDAVDYLLKPFNFEEFLRAAYKAQQRFNTMHNVVSVQKEIDYIFVKADYKQVRINLAEVLYFEGLKDYIKIILVNTPAPILTLMSIKALEQMLPASHFMRVHRSFIVNLNHVNTIDRSRIVIGKEMIPIADNYRDKFNNFLKNIE